MALKFGKAKAPVPSTSVGPAKQVALAPSQSTSAAIVPMPGVATSGGLRLRPGSVAALAAQAATQAPVLAKVMVPEPVQPATSQVDPLATSASTGANPAGALAPQPLHSTGSGALVLPGELSSSFDALANKQPTQFKEESVAAFKSLLEQLPTLFDEKMMLGNVLRRILAELNANPDFEAFLAPEDCGMMVRALRQSYGTQLELKVKKQRKPKKGSVDIDDILSIDKLDEMLIGLS